MSENKRKRLSLKTKKSSGQDSVQSGDDEVNVSKKRKIAKKTTTEERSTKQLGRIVEKPEEKIKETSNDVICLSDHDEGDGSSVVQPKFTRTSLLDVEDPELRNLRQCLLELRRLQPKEEYQELPPFPSSDFQTSEIDSQRETTPDAFLELCRKEYSPLPQMCSVCAKRKPLQYDYDTAINSILSDSNSRKTSFNTGKTSPSSSVSTDNNIISYPEKISNLGKTSSDNVSDSEKCSISEEIPNFEKQSRNRYILPTVKDAPKSSDNTEKDRAQSKGRGSDEKIHGEKTTNITKPAENQPSVSACPLCAMEFARGTSQMDIDGHIAACLSSADDDVIW